ncbi:hypothetical protein ACIOG7_10600 [Streptomyces sp. NPDC087894]|uniref:hypothetical protein n=1 Tax=Streptomyces sp. NPDC087894 TaxID=3365816 RepID=UPI0037FF76E1
MSYLQWLLAIIVVGWVGVIVLAGALFVIAYRAIAAEEGQAKRERGWETEPGLPSADLGDCWSIWPDAPLARDVRR